jgi:hypothetical protein
MSLLLSRIASLFLACGILTGSQAQGMFAGRLVDAATGRPISSAWVWVEKEGGSGFPLHKPRCERIDISRTDANGRFKLPATVTADQRPNIRAFAPGYGGDYRWAETIKVNGALFVKADIHTTVSSRQVVRQNMTVSTPGLGPPTQQQISDAYPSLPANVSNDGLPLFTLWPLHVPKPRRALGSLPPSCGNDHAAYVEATRELSDALNACKSAKCDQSPPEHNPSKAPP